MPVCVLCNKEFPNRMKIDGKIRVVNNRKRCIECYPFGTHNVKQVIVPNNCLWCGKKIKPKSSFSNDSLISEINHLDNLIALCPNHHWELDHRMLKL